MKIKINISNRDVIELVSVSENTNSEVLKIFISKILIWSHRIKRQIIICAVITILFRGLVYEVFMHFE